MPVKKEPSGRRSVQAEVEVIGTRSGLGSAMRRIGRVVSLIGLVLPLLLIGGLKFTQVEIDALKPMIGGTPWLAWMYPLFGEAGASYVLGVTELVTALLLIVSPWSALAGVFGGGLAAITFAVTCSMFLALPAWDASLGGFPALGPLGQFLIKDVALLGIALVIAGEGLSRRSRSAAATARNAMHDAARVETVR